MTSPVTRIAYRQLQRVGHPSSWTKYNLRILERPSRCKTLRRTLLGRSFAVELQELPATYRWAMKAEIRSLTAAIRGCLNVPLVAVGSGGSLTVAEFAAKLHRDTMALPAFAETPLDAVAGHINPFRHAVLMTTAGGRNPVPHPVPWTHICAMPPGVAHTPRAPRSACDTQASRDARSGCTAPRSWPRRRGRPRGSERFGRGSLAP